VSQDAQRRGSGAALSRRLHPLVRLVPMLRNQDQLAALPRR
jgi:hypothetical protein